MTNIKKTKVTKKVGSEAIKKLGWFTAHRFLLLRRLSQLSVLVLFLLGPLAGVWLIEGNLSSSLLLKVIPMTDPFILTQSLAAGFVPALDALLGAAIILLIYFIVGGRVFCSWVCPVNLITDFAYWCRKKLKLSSGSYRPSKNLRFWLLGAILLGSFINGFILWEMINPVSMFHRGILFGMGAGISVLIAVYLFDLLVLERGWCGYVCPMGAFYSLIGTLSPLAVSAKRREHCDDCLDCFVVCPEPQVLKGPLHGAHRGFGPRINSSQCTHCFRCIDVCAEDVFDITFDLKARFANNGELKAENKK